MNAQLAAKQATVDRDASLDVLRKDMTLLATYVENASGGDPVKIQSAGMDVKSDRTPLVELDQVLILALTRARIPASCG
jgi:hypothetical protein